MKRLYEGFNDSFDDNDEDYVNVFAAEDNPEFNKISQDFVKNLNVAEDNYEWTSEGLNIGIKEKVNIRLILLPGQTEIPYKFNIVNGSFDCSWNNMTSLRNAPNKVTGKFDCSWNNISSIEGIPDASDYDLSFNNFKLDAPFIKFLDGIRKESGPKKSKNPWGSGLVSKSVKVSGNRNFIKHLQRYGDRTTNNHHVDKIWHKYGDIITG